MEKEPCRLEIGALLGELLDRISAVLQNSLVAGDEGNGTAAGGRIHEGRVVRHHAEVIVVDLDLAQIGGADGFIGDGDVVRFAGAVICDREAVGWQEKLPPVLSTRANLSNV